MRVYSRMIFTYTVSQPSNIYRDFVNTERKQTSNRAYLAEPLPEGFSFEKQTYEQSAKE